MTSSIKLFATFFILASIYTDISLAQGPRKYHGSSTPSTKQMNAIRGLKSRCQVCLTIKKEMSGKTPENDDICDDKLVHDAESCEVILYAVITRKRSLDSYCNFICNKQNPSKKVIKKRSLDMMKEIE